jgi:GNAT superfamily N-acetyltransferase
MAANVTIDEIPIPDRVESAAFADFASSIAIRNAIEEHALGPAALTHDPAEMLTVFQEQEHHPKRVFLARRDGEPVGVLVFAWQGAEGANASWLAGGVLPDRRNRGIGTALLVHAEALAQASGRPVVQVQATHTTIPGSERVEAATGYGGVPLDDPGVRFLRHHGYTLEQVNRFSALELPVPSDTLLALRREAEGKAGALYRTATWAGAAPEERLAGLAHLSTRMSTDAPHGDLEVVEDVWDEARVRELETRLLGGGLHLLTAVVEHVPTSELVGYSRIILMPDRTRPALQGPTLILRGHRGHRLGMLVKITNLEQIAVVSPESRVIYTGNTEDNQHMLAVNQAVGFRPTGYEGRWKKRLL